MIDDPEDDGKARNSSPSESVEFTGSALEFLKEQAKDEPIEGVVSSAVGAYAYLKDQAKDGVVSVIDKNGKVNKIRI